MKNLVYILVCFFLTSTMVNGQMNVENALKLDKADKLFNKKEYSNALTLYSQLAKTYHNNGNLYFKMGVCYLNDLNYHQIRKAINLLEKAVEQIDTALVMNQVIDNRKSPPDALLYLSKAYSFNFEFDKAIESLKKYEVYINKSDKAKLSHINREIQNTINTKEKYLNPVDYTLTNLEKVLDFPYDIDNYPVLSKNENVLVYTIGTKNNDLKEQKKEMTDDDLEKIYFSKRTNGQWSRPVNISEQLDFDTRTLPVSLSPDGSDLYLVRDDGDDGNIYVSHYNGKKWGEMIRLNDNINTKNWESHACVANNGNSLYFTSNRPGGYGGLDIYRSDRDSTGDWGQAINLGPEVNTKYNEDMPFYFDDDKQLFFCSQGHFSSGGFDLLSNRYLDPDSCSLPFNYGEPVNSSFDDYIYVLKVDSQFLFFPVFININSDQNYNCFVVNKTERNPEQFEKNYQVEGVLSIEDQANSYLNNVKVTLIDMNTTDTVNIFTQAQMPAKYSVNLVAGSYKLVYQAEGYEKQTKNIEIPIGGEVRQMNMNVNLKQVLYSVNK